MAVDTQAGLKQGSPSQAELGADVREYALSLGAELYGVASAAEYAEFVKEVLRY